MQASLCLCTNHLPNCCFFKRGNICLVETFHRIVECFGLKGTLKISNSSPFVIGRDIFHHTNRPKALSGQALNSSRDWASTIFSVFDNGVVWENQERIWHVGIKIPWRFLHHPWLTFSILQSTCTYLWKVQLACVGSSGFTIPHRVFSLKHSVHSMSSHCALHSSHLSVSSTKDILPLLQDCRSGFVQSPFLGHLSFLFHHLLWAVASPGKIFGYMLEETFIYCKGFCTPQEQVEPPIKPRVRAEKRQHSNTNFFALLTHTSQCSVSLFNSKATLGTL